MPGDGGAFRTNRPEGLFSVRQKKTFQFAKYFENEWNQFNPFSICKYRGQ